jgi:hypothetical protein
MLHSQESFHIHCGKIKLLKRKYNKLILFVKQNIKKVFEFQPALLGRYVTGFQPVLGFPLGAKIRSYVSGTTDPPRVSSMTFVDNMRPSDAHYSPSSGHA